MNLSCFPGKQAAPFFLSFIVSILFYGCRYAEPRKPNVIIILADDLAWGDPGFNGNPLVETPNLDSLAAGGARFERFYMSPDGASSRASLLTGRYSLRTGTLCSHPGWEAINPEEFTLGELFQSNGYFTGYFGKWENGAHYPSYPNDQGFQEFYGFCGESLIKNFNSQLEKNRHPVRAQGFITDDLTSQAIRFIDKNKERSFFCFLSLSVPHGPLQAPPHLVEKYRKKNLDEERASIYGLCENLDSNIGRLEKKLDELNLNENTILIFLSDNGPATFRFNGNLKGIKNTEDEGAVRVPCLFRWPGKIMGNTLVKQTGAHIDIFPTLSDLCGLKPASATLDGSSMAAILLGNDVPVTDRMIYSHITYPGERLYAFPGAVRTNQFRLILNRDSLELYDMQEDPSQLINISRSQSLITRQLYNEYNNWFKQISFSINMKRAVLLESFPIHLRTEEAYHNGRPFPPGEKDESMTKTGNQLHQNDTLDWNVRLQRPGKFDVYLRYQCSPEFIGSHLELSIAGQSIPISIDSCATPDPSEPIEKGLGTIQLPEGDFVLHLLPQHLNSKGIGTILGINLLPKQD